MTQGGFLQHVLRLALPGALSIVVDMLIIQVLGVFFGLSPELVSTYNLLVAGFISMMVLVEVSSPLNLKRKILCVAMIVLFCGGVLFFGGFFSVTSVFQWRMLFVVPVMVITYPLMNYLMMFMKWCTLRRRKIAAE